MDTSRAWLLESILWVVQWKDAFSSHRLCSVRSRQQTVSKARAPT